MELKNNIIVYIGDVKEALSEIPDEIADCIITSPPYWKQRNYKHPNQIGQEENYSNYIEKLIDVFNGVKRVLKPTGTFFLNVGYKYKNKELLLIPEMLAIELQRSGWTLINKIIWHKPNAMPSPIVSRFSNVYEPVFLFVKSESKYLYFLNIDKLRNQSNGFYYDKRPEEILGLKVINSLVRDEKIEGTVTNVYKDENGVVFVQVEWENGSRTIEVVQDFKKESRVPIKLNCEVCGKEIKNEKDILEHDICDSFPIPELPSEHDMSNLKEIKSPKIFDINRSNRRYKGKFMSNSDNRGASPGARKSLFGEYFVLQRKYKVFQFLIADYLRYWRKKSGITIKEIDKHFGYKDTAGHWFRKDAGSWGRGGSIPLPKDWYKLKEILGFDDIYDRWITETHLVLQTVRPHPKGRNPGDIWKIKLQQLKESHFATFPEELVRRCILAGCPENGIVLDPFAGSGTTGKVAVETGRNAILIELVPEYLDIIKRRCGDINEVIYVK